MVDVLSVPVSDTLNAPPALGAEWPPTVQFALPVMSGLNDCYQSEACHLVCIGLPVYV